MNKTELEADIVARVGPILEISEVDTQRPAKYGKWYRAVCKATAGGLTAYAQSVYYYVFDQGTGTEAAFYKDKLPEKLLEREDFKYTTAWRDVVQLSIAVKESAGVIEKGIIRSVNEEKQLAVVEVYLLDATTLRNRMYLCYRDKDSKEVFERIIQE